MSSERGTSLVEIVVLGFAVVALILPVVLTVAKLSEATAIVTEEARSTATWVARHGSQPHVDHRSEITIDVSNGVVHVSSSMAVDLVSVGRADVGTTVSSSFSMPVSQYRSGR